MKNRKGIIKVGKQGVEMLDSNPSFVKVLFTNFSPYHIEVDCETGGRIYEGFSPLFRELGVNELLPIYTYEITKYIGQDYRFIKFIELTQINEIDKLKEIVKNYEFDVTDLKLEMSILCDRLKLSEIEIVELSELNHYLTNKCKELREILKQYQPPKQHIPVGLRLGEELAKLIIDQNSKK